MISPESDSDLPNFNNPLQTGHGKSDDITQKKSHEKDVKTSEIFQATVPKPDSSPPKRPIVRVIEKEKFDQLMTCFTEGNVEKAQELLSVGLRKFASPKQLDDLLDQAFESSKRIQFINILINCFHQDTNFFPKLLDFAVKENQLDVIETAIKNPYLQASFNEFKNDSPESIALQKQFLSSGRALNPNFLQHSANYLISLDDPEKMKQQLLLGFLNSKGIDVLELIGILLKNEKVKSTSQKQLEEVINFIHNEGSLIARFPEQQNQRSMVAGYSQGSQSIDSNEKTISRYLFQQINYSKSRKLLYTQVLEAVKSQNLGFKEAYIRLMKTPPEIAAELRHENTTKLDIYPTTIQGRYKDFMNIARVAYNTESENLVKSTTKVPVKAFNSDTETQQALAKNGLNADLYSILHTLKDGNKINLTSIYILKNLLFFSGMKQIEGLWVHTAPENLKELENELQELFQNIIQNSKKIKETGLPLSSDLKKEIALFYYLGIQAMLAYRGNSQIMLEMHKMLYEIHGFQTGPLSQKFVLPDCVALCLPFDVFYRDYYDKLWEWPPKPITVK